MTQILSMRLELGEVTDGNDDPTFDEAVIFFEGLYDSPEIHVNAPNAPQVAARIVELWNAALSRPARADPMVIQEGKAKWPY